MLFKLLNLRMDVRTSVGVSLVYFLGGGGLVVRWCWVNFLCRGMIEVVVGQGPTTIAIGADGVCLDIFSLIYLFAFLSPSLWETARYRLKYCLKGPFNKKTTKQQAVLKVTGVTYISLFSLLDIFAWNFSLTLHSRAFAGNIWM